MITKDIKTKIREYFFLNPTTKLRVRQIERVVKVPLPSAIRYTKELVANGILKITEIAGIKLFSADRKSTQFLLEKKLFNIKNLFDQSLVSYLINEFSNPTIVVFGSYIKGEDIESSDIDLYIETPSKKKVVLNKFEKKLQRNIQLFKHKKITEIKNKNLINNILNGLTINGFLEAYK
jgi:predicted nucleotidyltransferase